YQGVFQNPMASPTTLGVKAGGILGGIVYILFFWDSSFMNALVSEYGTETTGGGLVWAASTDELMEIYSEMSVFDLYGMTICTVLGCFAGVMLIVGISMISGKGKINTLSLMLSGSIFATVVNTVTQTVQYAILYNVGVDSTDVRLSAIASLQGSSSSISNRIQLAPFLFVAIPVGLCLVICFAMTGKLNILVFGEDEARAMGVPVQRFRVILIICCTVMTATVMAFCGQISMLGFLMPHLARFLVGPDFKHLVPASALLGGIGCLIVANVCSATMSYGNFNTYIGVFCTVASILFILLYRRNRHADWS
ncbi:MAG: iron ABC transporter permease, partial [Oscillospiraceae bacterium]|nr:iron ABC transporter permease [Oscillospiraceae bacterium]